MQILKPETYKSDKDHDEEMGGKVFDPSARRPGRLVCICDYELVKDDDGSYRCSGGGHRYRISEGQVHYDKFGNILLNVPEDSKNEQNDRSTKKRDDGKAVHRHA